MYLLVNYVDGKSERVTLNVKNNNVKFPSDLNYQEISDIDFYFNDYVANEGDEGYIVFPNNQMGYFKGKDNIESKFSFDMLPIFGIKSKDKSFVAILKGMRYDARLVAGAKNGKYYCYIRYNIDTEKPYEEISIDFHYFTYSEASYSRMAQVYRKYQLDRGACVPIKDRMNEHLEYAKDSVYIRIRQAWKPVPTPVLEQTPETEPELRVACTFSDVEKIMMEYKKQGIEKAEFCLVGWNYRGHDGRYPQMFPVEPELGGEEGLRKLVQKTRELGYKLVCHTNSTDAYSIADCWSEDLIAKTKNGKLFASSTSWSGGTMYNMCARKAYELAERDLPKVADLGFKGIQYIDVLTTVTPKKCYDNEHPLDRNEAIFYNKKIMDLASNLFGGFSSEGGYDFAADKLDYALYISFADPFSKFENSMASKCIPLWQIVYHGIILSNPFVSTVNAPIKSSRVLLKAIEYGARPTLYYYSKFVTENNNIGRTNWMGSTDFTCDTDEELKKTTKLAKEYYDEYNKILWLQTEFIDSHEEISDNVFEITYSDGTKITVDYNNETYRVD